MAKRPPNLKTKRAAPRGWTATQRTSRHARGYGSEWDKLRARILDRDRHLCQPCFRFGRPSTARAVDHTRPKQQRGTAHGTHLEAIIKPSHRVTLAPNSPRPPRRQ